MASRSAVARLEDRFNRCLNFVLRRRGWTPVVIPHVGYAGDDFVQVLGRVLLSPPDGTHPDEDDDPQNPDLRRGWRNFLTAEVAHATIEVDVAGHQHRARTDRAGHIDVRVPNPGLEPGIAHVAVSVDGRATRVPVAVVAEGERLGIVSDIDDTVIDTALPRPLLAAYNTFVLGEGSRSAVPHMAELYDWLRRDHPAAPVVYVSTGAWNTLATIRRFLHRHGFPEGPLLMTDWGPTNTGFFRSGQAHKRRCLRQLATDFPQVRWVLVGDDGQHDPELYSEFAHAYPEHVRAIGIRQLHPGIHGSDLHERDTAIDDLPPHVLEVRGPDGQALREAFVEGGIDLD